MIQYDFDNLNIKLIQHKHKVRKLLEETEELNKLLKEYLGRYAGNIGTDQTARTDTKK
jgi:hypothetical protein